MVEHLPASKQVLLRNNNTMSDHIYSQFFSESTSSLRICQYVHCGATLTKDDQKKFCNLACCNRQNALKQRQEAEKRRDTKRFLYEADPRRCMACSQPIGWESFIKSKAKYCSNSCASTYTNSKRSQSSRNKQRATILQKFNSGNLPDRSFKELYYSLAAFKFDVYDYPNLMNLDLIDQYGWYACGGRTKTPKNLGGVTRDHILSIRDGLNHNIHPLLLSHPTNCRLLLASDNSRKSAHSGITIDTLINNIKRFGGKFQNQSKCLSLIEEGKVIISDRQEFIEQYISTEK